MLKAGCDLSVEACDSAIETSKITARPAGDDFNSLTWGYISEIFILLISPLIPLLFFNTSSNTVGLEAIIFFIPGLIAFYIYVVPLLLSVIYMIFGANFFLFSWLDNALVFLIEHYISNIQLGLLGTVLWSYWVIRVNEA